MTDNTQKPGIESILRLILLLVVALTFPAMSASAQDEEHHADSSSTEAATDTAAAMMPMGQGEMMPMMQSGMMPMMQSGMMPMMQQMTQNPLSRSAVLVHVLPNLKESLTLSADQVSQLEGYAEEFDKEHQAHMQQILDTGDQLRQLLTAEDDASSDEVDRLLETAAVHRAQMQALAYETAGRMKDVLTTEQRTELSEMNPAQFQRSMMTSMTMMEMMQSMQTGTMSCAMMQGGMMQSGMMRGSGMMPMMGSTH